MASKKERLRADLVASLRANVPLLSALILMTCFLASPLWFWHRARELNALAETIKWKRAVPRLRRDLCMTAFCAEAVSTALDLLPGSYNTIWQIGASGLAAAIVLFQALVASRIIRRA